MNTKYFLSTGFTLSLFGLLFVFILSSLQGRHRSPASQFQGYTLQFKKIEIPENSKLKELDGAILRVSMDRKNPKELNSDEPLSLQQGDSRTLDYSVSIDPLWIRNDKLEFRIELVQKGTLLDKVLVRCSQVSQKVSEYNRNYQCFIPGDEDAFLTYRLAGDRQKSAPSLAHKNR